MYYKNPQSMREDLVTLETILKKIIEINEGQCDQPSDIERDSLEFQLASIMKSICHAMYELELTGYRYRIWEALETMFEAIKNFEPHEND